MAQPVPAKTPSPLVWLLLLLSATTGMVDAASILGMGKVFTANMTGNVVFLGFAAARAPGFTPTPYVAALASFMAGALAAGRIWRAASGRHLRHTLLIAAFIESGLLVLAGLCAILVTSGPVMPMIVLTAGAMGFRNAIVRQLKVPDLTTTVLTLTITGIAADNARLNAALPTTINRLAAVGMVFAGAVFGAAILIRFGVAATLLLTGAIVLGGTLAFTRHPRLADWQQP